MKKTKASESRKIIFGQLYRRKLFILGILFITLLISLLGLVHPIVYKMMIDQIIPARDQYQLLFMLLILIVTPWLIVLATSLKNYWSALLGGYITRTLREKCFEICLGAKYKCFENLTADQIIHKITRECGRVGELYITNDVITFITELISFFVIIITIFVLNRFLSLICLVSFPVLFLIMKVVSQKNKELDYKLSRILNKGQGLLMEVFSHLKMIKLKNGEAKERGIWSCWLNDYERIRLKSAVTHNMNRFLLGDLLAGCVYGAVFYAGSLEIMNGQMELGTLVSFVAFVPRLFNIFKNLLSVKVSSSVIQNALTSIDEILELEQETTGDKTIQQIEKIEFRNVCFHYDNSSFGLQNISFSAKKNECIGFVGLSGSGKSTIFDLLSRCYDYETGEIQIDHVPIRDLNLKELRKRIAVVTQDSTLLNQSIRENLLYPGIHVQPDMLEKVIQVVSLTELLQRLPEGLDAPCGESGKLLSGGECQRILLANALLSDADVLLLDEFTSALDVETERKINDFIFNLPGKIVLVITHRTYMTTRLNRVYLIQEGRIIEEGVPQELIADPSSQYYKLCRNIQYNETE